MNPDLHINAGITIPDITEVINDSKPLSTFSELKTDSLACPQNYETKTHQHIQPFVSTPPFVIHLILTRRYGTRPSGYIVACRQSFSFYELTSGV